MLDVIWFPERRSILIANPAGARANLFCELEAADHLGPRASQQRRRFWTLQDKRIVRIPTNGSLQYEFFGTATRSVTSVILDSEFAEQGTLLVALYASEDRPDLTHVEFIRDADNWRDPLRLHQHLQRLLGSKTRNRVVAVWHAPTSSSNGEMRVGPARAISFAPERATVDVLAPTCTSGAVSKISLSASAGSLQDNSLERDSAARLDSNQWIPVILIWRSVFAERAETRSSPVLESFQDYVQAFLGQGVPFIRNPARSGVALQPVVQGRLRPRLNAGEKHGTATILEFEGAVDLRDVVALCIARQLSQPVELRYAEQSVPEPHRYVQGGYELNIVCWTAELDQLRAIAWSDLPAPISSIFTDRLNREFARTEGRVDESNRPVDDGWAQELIIAATAAAPRLDYRTVFTADEELAGTVDEWFATLPMDDVEKFASKSGEPIEATNLARFLPLALHKVPHSLSSWIGLDRDAAALYAEICELADILQLSMSFSGHLRSDARIWKSLRIVADAIGQAGEARLIAALNAFEPEASGKLATLEPDALRQLASLLEKLRAELKELEVVSGD